MAFCASDLCRLFRMPSIRVHPPVPTMDDISETRRTIALFHSLQPRIAVLLDNDKYLVDLIDLLYFPQFSSSSLCCRLHIPFFDSVPSHLSRMILAYNFLSLFNNRSPTILRKQKFFCHLFYEMESSFVMASVIELRIS